MLQGRDTVCILGEHCVASVLAAVGFRATLLRRLHSLFDADARSLNWRLELIVIILKPF